MKLMLAPDGLPVYADGNRSILTVAEFGLLGTDVLLSGRWPDIPGDPEHAIAWLLDNVSREGDMLIWRYPYARRCPEPGWASAHAQAQAVRLLVRHDAADDIDALLRPFETPIDDGGVADGAWLEKHAQPGFRTDRVLNGMLFTLDALHDISERAGKGRPILTRGLASLRATLPRFDLDGWPAYDTSSKRSSRHYQRLTVALLDRLHEATGQATFAKWRDAWS